MANKTPRPVVILYEHALLGEGIAEYILAQLGVEATVASALDRRAIISALALGPCVVIFELTESLRRVDLTTLAPRAVLIDVSTVVTRGQALCSPAAAGYEGSCKSYATARGDAVTRRHITRTAHVFISGTMTGQPSVTGRRPHHRRARRALQIAERPSFGRGFDGEARSWDHVVATTAEEHLPAFAGVARRARL